MLIPFIIGVFAVFLTYLTRGRQNSVGLKMAFVVIFMFLALRYDYGNDYMAYLDGYNEITSNVEIFLTGMKWEPGWNLLHLLFKPFGFFIMVMFTSLLTSVVLYRFIRDCVPAQYQWVAVFLYVFDPYQILVPASAMRQNMGILLLIVGLEFLYKKRIIIYLLLAAAAVSFHRSGIILLPLAVLPFLAIRINKVIAFVIGVAFVSLFFFGHVVIPYVGGYFGQTFVEFTETYSGGSSFNTGIGFFYALFQLIAILYYAGLEYRDNPEHDEYQDVQNEVEMSLEPSMEIPLLDKHTKYMDIRARRLLFLIALMSFMFTPLSLQLAMIGRLNMYFTPVTIAIYPIILFASKDKFFRLIFLGSLIPFTLFRFWAFFLSPVWRDKFGTYQTIFSAPQWY